MDPEFDPDTHSGPPEYFGDDTRLTSRKELSGWYSYGWAAEVFVICGIGGRTLSVGGTSTAELIGVVQGHLFPLPWSSWLEIEEYSCPINPLLVK